MLHVCLKCNEEALPERCEEFKFDWEGEPDPVASTICSETIVPHKEETNPTQK